ncbi:YbjQ family protein [Luminiphilus sp.]|nr:YbjQ family protein [Luminiphilus sp.]MDB3918443.1 YbjQ family protein [Luminiphilus sp.]
MARECSICGTKLGGFSGAPVSYKDASRCLKCDDKKLDPEVVAEGQRVEELKNNADKLAKGVAISTTAEIFGREIIDHVGIARGGTVRAKNAISDIGAGIKNMVGGEVKAYTQLLADAREQAIHRMKVDAVLMGANAVVGVNFSTSMIDVGTAEIAAFGTAVTLAEEDIDD